MVRCLLHLRSHLRLDAVWQAHPGGTHTHRHPQAEAPRSRLAMPTVRTQVWGGGHKACTGPLWLKMRLGWSPIGHTLAPSAPPRRCLRSNPRSGQPVFKITSRKNTQISTATYTSKHTRARTAQRSGSALRPAARLGRGVAASHVGSGHGIISVSHLSAPVREVCTHAQNHLAGAAARAARARMGVHSGAAHPCWGAVTLGGRTGEAGNADQRPRHLRG